MSQEVHRKQRWKDGHFSLLKVHPYSSFHSHLSYILWQYEPYSMNIIFPGINRPLPTPGRRFWGTGLCPWKEVNLRKTKDIYVPRCYILRQFPPLSASLKSQDVSTEAQDPVSLEDPDLLVLNGDNLRVGC